MVGENITKNYVGLQQYKFMAHFSRWLKFKKATTHLVSVECLICLERQLETLSASVL